jgi:aconitase A
MLNHFGSQALLRVGDSEYTIFRLDAVSKAHPRAERLPYSLKVLLENLLRNEDGVTVRPDDIEALANWDPHAQPCTEIAFTPARVLLQDFTGVPAVVDLAAMRDAMLHLGGNPRKINPLLPAELVIDHSVQVDDFGSALALRHNEDREFARNLERYAFLRWGQKAFRNFKVVPPDTGIVHQVNLEYLARVVFPRERPGESPLAYPDTLVGTDSHTTMINGLGVLGWGVGGIEAEAAMLGQPVSMLIPEVVGFKLSGQLRPGATATDLVLTVTEALRSRFKLTAQALAALKPDGLPEDLLSRLRKLQDRTFVSEKRFLEELRKGDLLSEEELRQFRDRLVGRARQNVVGKFVEFYGPGLADLPVADRATIANMAPEYGATCGIFPVDAETLRYLRFTGRQGELIDLVEAYTREQGLFHTPSTPEAAYSDTVELDLGSVEPSLAGPTRPQDRVPLSQSKPAFAEALQTLLSRTKLKSTALPLEPVATTIAVPATLNGGTHELHHGSVVIAAITSCTNTSNPSVMLAAGLLAKKAVERDLHSKPWVKTSLAPGSKVVTDYLSEAGLMRYLEQLRFNTVGYGCTTCIAAGTPVLLGNGTARRIEQMPGAGGAVLFGPTQDGKLGLALQAEAMPQGVRDCVTLVLQDGRELVCTPDHEVLCAGGRWVRADQLEVGRERVVIGLEAPLDEPGADEANYLLSAGEMTFTLDTPANRLRALAFARLLGHLLGDGSISAAGQGRMNVGQAVDRDVVLNDVEMLTGKRPAATQYDERKWAIVLPTKLTEAVVALPGVRVGRRIDQAPGLPAFVLDERCPVALVREFLGGVFGADGKAPTLKRLSERAEDAILEPPAYAQSARPEHVAQLKGVMAQLTRLLARCGVQTEGAKVYEFPVRRSASSYPAAQDGPRVEVRLQLPDGLSFVQRVGFRYCVDKALRASAAAVYWRTVEQINRQRLWMAARLEEVHREHPELSFPRARTLAAAELSQRETIVFPHYSLLQGNDRFARLPKPEDRKFRPLHRDSCGFPSPVEVLEELGVRDWFAPLLARAESDYSKRYCVEKTSLTLPTFTLRVVDRRPAGEHPVFDLSVHDLHAFVAGTVAVSNCIGNSGPLPEPVSRAIEEGHLVAVAVLSGNRNFEGRVHPEVRANYLASPPLVVAYALAGRMDIDLEHEPLGHDKNGQPVYLKDIWPSPQEVAEAIAKAVHPEMFGKEYGEVFQGTEKWRSLSVPEGDLYQWQPSSTYVKHPPYFEHMTPEVPPIKDIKGARVLALLGDSITTDHISPAGSIKPQSPAGRYLIEHGVQPADFNSYGSRRGNHEVMVRGTFANVRLRNGLAPGTEGGVTQLLPGGEQMSIYDASVRYAEWGVPLIVLAGKEYGSGSSRDWAAKGPLLLGVRAVIAESYERIHRSNLVGMGLLPLQFLAGQTINTLGLTGEETYDIEGLGVLFAEHFTAGKEIRVRARSEDGGEKTFQVVVRIDTPQEVRYYQHGGILQYVLRQLLAQK